MPAKASGTEVAYWLILPAAGVGSRMLADRPKQYLEIAGISVLEHTLKYLTKIIEFKGVIVAVSAEDPYWHGLSLESKYGIQRVTGGNERCNSVMNALNAIQDQVNDRDWVLVHDAARPCVREQDIEKLIREVSVTEVGGILASRVRDTMKRIEDNHIAETVDRKNLWHALTPQMFPYKLLCESMTRALNDGFLVTDEASAVEYSGKHPIVVEGHSDNIKITQPEDLALAEFYLRQQGRVES